MDGVKKIALVLLITVGVIGAYAAQTVSDRIEIDNDNINSAIEAGDLFGYQIVAITDIDNNGTIDLAVTKFSDDSGETDAGSILILFMNSDGTVDSTNEIIMDDSVGNLAGCLGAASLNRDTGSLEQLVFVGDLDSDGEVTIALGANSNDHDTGSGVIVDSGAVYMLELNSDGTVDNCVLITEDSNGFAPADGVYREDAAANFGWPVIATDLNGDGQNELLVGANSESNLQTDLWVLFLTTTGAVSSHPATPVSGLTIGIDSNEFIADGASISGTKIVVSNENDGDGGGSVFIVNLSAAGAFVSVTEIAGSTIAGIANDERFGSSVAPLGDMDNDGVDDIIVGNEAGDDTNSLSGEVHIIYLNSDDTLKESQKISNESENTRTGSDPFAASDLFGASMTVWKEDGTNAVIAIGATQDDTGAEANSGAVHLFYVARAIVTTSGGGGGCSDCIPPTFGKNKNGVLLVSEGFSFNGNATDVIEFHTKYDLITVITNQTNTVTVKIYENNGVNNIQMVQFGMGMPEVRSPLKDAQTLVEISLVGAEIEKIEKDKNNNNNLIDILNGTTSIVDCGYVGTENCLQVTLEYVYRDQPKYNIMAINAMDYSRNAQTNYLNDGILVIGESLNDSHVQKVTASKGGVYYPQIRGSVILTLEDYKTDIWKDEFDYQWSTNEYGPYLLDTLPVPELLSDKHSKWSGFNDRNHSGFESYKELQKAKAMLTMMKMDL